MKEFIKFNKEGFQAVKENPKTALEAVTFMVVVFSLFYLSLIIFS
tara:strand:+ start:556 stop:690 length:135 start_codon:yes stop_codon:yes gene_type:complete